MSFRIKNNTDFLVVLSCYDRKGGYEEIIVKPYGSVELSELMTTVSIDHIYKEVSHANQEEKH